MNGLELSLEIPWQNQLPLPALLMLQLVPLIGSGLVYRLRQRRLAGILATAIALIQLGIVLWLWLRFDPTIVPMQFAERLTLAGPFIYHTGLDGLNLVFLQALSLLSLGLVLYGQVRQLPESGRLASLILLGNAAGASMLLTLDLFWFWLLANLQLWVIGRLLKHWADGPLADWALARFWQFMAIAQLLFLTGILMLGWHHADIINGNWSFDLLALRQVNIHQGFSQIIFFLFLLGLGLRVPVFPLHGWLPGILEQAGLGLAAVLLLGIKLGLYAMLRFLLPLLPEVALHWQHFIIGVSVSGVFYGTLLGILQTDLRKQLAYISLAQSGLLSMGIFSLSKSGFQGSALLTVNFGLGISSLLLLMGLVCARTQSPSLPRLQGLIKPMPLLALTFFLASLSLLAIPSAPGFDALLLLLEGAIRRFGALLVVFTALGNLAVASLMLWVFHQVFIAKDETAPIPLHQFNLTQRLRAQLLVLLLLASLALTGFHPEPWLRLLEQPAGEIGRIFQNQPPPTQSQN